MRAFVGIELEPVWREALSEACSHIRETDEVWRADKWVEPQNLHLTLKFLGEISPESALTFAKDLSLLAASSDPFLIDADRYVWPVPSPRRTSMLWCTFNDSEGECRELAAAIERLATTYGIAPEKRPFSPHATLARARRPHPFTQSDAAAKVAESYLLREGVASMSVRNATLFRSTLTRTGPRYERLAIARLGE